MLKNGALVVLAIFVLSSCATYRNANEDGYSVVTGGYSDEKIEDGVFRISSESGVSPVEQKLGVTRVWKRRAKELCLDEYKEIKFEVNIIDQGFNYMDLDIIGYYVTRASGYAICSSFNGTHDEALDVINAPMKLAEKQRQVQKEKLLSLMEAGCDSTSMDLDTLENIGDGFFEHELYSEAMTCYLGVYEKDKSELTKVEVYYHIGLIYELGLGVQESMEKAMQWYKLAGLI